MTENEKARALKVAKAKACIAELEQEVFRLEKFLHARKMHPDFEYATTTGPRKAFDEDPPEGAGWVRNLERGDQGWERFDYHEEAYWRRLKSKGE